MEGFGLFAAALMGLEALAAEAAVPDVAEDLVDRAAALARVMRLGGEAGAAIVNFWRWWLLLLQYGMVWVTTIVNGQKQWQKTCWSLDWIGREKSGMMARGSGRRVLLTNSSLEFVGPSIAA